jgi:hypothetical protein
VTSTDSDQFSLELVDSGLVLTEWSQYTYNESYGRATDSLTLSVGDRETVREYYERLKPGTRVRLLVGNKPQATFYVDKRTKKGAREGGNTLQISCRNSLSPLCDSGVNPLYQFGAKTTLNDVYQKVIKSFGHYRVISTTDIARRSVVTGNLKANTRELRSPGTIKITSLARGAQGSQTTQTQKVTSFVLQEYDPTKPRFLKNFDVHQIKPHFGEGSYEFLARLSKRFRLGLRADALGEAIIVDAPNFDQAPIFSLTRSGEYSDFLELELETDATELPTSIIGVGVGGGGQFRSVKLKRAIVNEITGFDSTGKIRPEVQAVLAEHKGLVVIPHRPKLLRYASFFEDSPVRAMYMHDEESRTPGQLEGFLRHELATRQAKAIQVKARVRGHTNGGVPWATNTICAVFDVPNEVTGEFWIKDKTFTKSRSGTFTDLTMIPPGLFEF